MTDNPREQAEAVSAAGSTDEVSWTVTTEEGEIKVKGPDPEVWGDDEERPQSGSAALLDEGLGVGEIFNEGDPENEIKGPGEWWQGRHYDPNL